MEPLSPTDEELAFHVAAGKSHKEAGQAVGLARNTVWRRALNPAFQARVHQLRRLVIDSAICRLAERADDAVESLHLLATSSQDEAVRMRSADLLLGHLTRLSERADIEERLRRLEEGGEVRGATEGPGATGGEADRPGDEPGPPAGGPAPLPG